MARQQYICWFFPGSLVSETLDIPVENRDIPKRKEGAYGFYFYETEEVQKDGETLKGGVRNKSPNYYWGEAYPLDRIKKEFPHEHILISNIESNGYKRAIRTVRGNWQFLTDEDVVLKDGK